MTTTTTDDSAAVIDAFDQLFEKYATIQELVAEMRELPQTLAESETICNNCLMRLTLSASMLLKKISNTGYEEVLDDCASMIHPILVCEEVASEPAPSRLH